MNFEFKTISSKEVFHNPYWDYYLDRYSIDNEECDYHYVRSRGSVIIIPKLDDNNYIMINQYRYLNKKFSLEFPGGGVEPNLNFYQTAKKELEEETGFTSNSITCIGEFNPCKGITNEICKVFLADKLELIKSKSDRTEKIKVQSFSLEQINQMVISNKIWDGMSITSLYFYVSKFSIKL